MGIEISVCRGTIVDLSGKPIPAIMIFWKDEGDNITVSSPIMNGDETAAILTAAAKTRKLLNALYGHDLNFNIVNAEKPATVNITMVEEDDDDEERELDDTDHMP